MNRSLELPMQAVSWMPKLEIMEIGNSGEWTEEKGHACIFRYTFNERDGPMVTWSSTWPAEKDLVLSPDLIQKWQVITSHTGHQLKVERKPLVGVGLDWPYQLSCLHVAVVPWLLLKKDILSGLSRFQLINELHSRFRDRELCWKPKFGGFWHFHLLMEVLLL